MNSLKSASKRVKPVHSDDRRVIYEWFLNKIGGKPIRKICFFEGRSGKFVGNHFHRKAWELYFIISGQGVMMLEDLKTKKVKKISAKPMTAISIRPGVAHKLIFCSDMTFEIASVRPFSAKDVYHHDISSL